MIRLNVIGKETGYLAGFSSCLQAIDSLLTQHQKELVLFSGKDSHHFWELEKKLKLSPACFLVVITPSEPHQFPAWITARNPLWIKPLTSRQRFQDRIRHHLGIQDPSQMAKRPVQMKPASSGFFTLEFDRVIEQIFANLALSYRCENVFWLSFSAFKDLNKGLANPAFLERLGDFLSYDIRFLFDSPQVRNQLEEISNACFEDLKSSMDWIYEIQALETQTRRDVLIPIVLEDHLVGVVILWNVIAENWITTVKSLTDSMPRWTSHLAFSYQYQTVVRESYVDHTTGQFNGRYLSMALDAEMDRSLRNKTPFCLLFVDVDRFKSVNDHHGHLVGSDVLKRLGERLTEYSPPNSKVFRYGGDEFVVLLPMTSADRGLEIGEKIRANIEKNPFQGYKANLNLTVSIGVAAFPENADNKRDLLHMADEAMYHGKYLSRNTVQKAG